jgi:hypothetical protein
MEDVPPEYHKLLCDRIEQKLKGINLLFANIPLESIKSSLSKKQGVK